MYEKIKRFYDLGLYNKANVGAFVEKGKITAKQYKEITGEAYKK